MTTWHDRGADTIKELERIIDSAKTAIAYDKIIDLVSLGRVIESYGQVLQDIKWLRKGQSSELSLNHEEKANELD